jgi:hypothetical protein
MSRPEITFEIPAKHRNELLVWVGIITCLDNLRTAEKTAGGLAGFAFARTRLEVIDANHRAKWGAEALRLAAKNGVDLGTHTIETRFDDDGPYLTATPLAQSE